MGLLMNQDPTQTHKTLHNFQFSGVGVDKLGASEYTIVTIVQDTSTSVTAFKIDMEKTLQQILEACKKSPRSENLLLRLIEFNDNAIELHGFRELREISANEYDNILHPRGWTMLNDAVLDAVESTEVYGKQLADMDYLCNAIIFVITDGDDNRSKIARDPAVIKKAIDECRKHENLESINVVLVAINNDDPYFIDVMENFKTAAGFDQFVKMGEATPGKLAKLADFVSRSISSTSQALGSGAPSQPLTF